MSAVRYGSDGDGIGYGDGYGDGVGITSNWI